jgi:hypothetical protein
LPLEPGHEPSKAPVEWGLVRSGQRLPNAHKRRDALRDGEREREAELFLNRGRQRLCHQDDDAAVVGEEGEQVPFDGEIPGHQGARLFVGRGQDPRGRSDQPKGLRDDGQQPGLVGPGDLEQVRHEVPAVEHLSGERLLDFAHRRDLALDDEGAQRHSPVILYWHLL